MRGVKKQGQMTASMLTGIFKKKEARDEFYNLIK
jgi:GTP cyclohydrolase I